MGTYKKGILSPFRGKIGTVIGSVWNGIFHMKSLPDITPNRKPTTAQLNQQIVFALITGFLKPLKRVLEIGYQSFTKGVTPVNAATGYHLKFAVTGTAPNYEVDYPKVILSVGDLEAPQEPGITATAGTAKVVFDWGALVDPEVGNLTDRATFVAYNPTLKKYTTIRNVIARSALTYPLQLPAAWIGHEAHFWMAFTSLDGKVVSNSAYVGLSPVL